MSRDRMREIVSEKICFGRSDIFAANILRGSGHESGERIELGHLGSADLAALSNHFPQSTFIDKNRTLLKGTRHVVPTMGAALTITLSDENREHWHAWNRTGESIFSGEFIRKR